MNMHAAKSPRSNRPRQLRFRVFSFQLQTVPYANQEDSVQ